MQSDKIFIHVGLPKTATTYMQQKVFPYVSGLQFISRPFTQENHAFNALQYAGDEFFEAQALRDAVAGAADMESDDPILIYDELLSGLPLYNFINRDQIASRLGQAFPQGQVIVFLRGQRSLINSLYSQYIRIRLFAGLLDERFISAPGPGRSEIGDQTQGKLDWDPARLFINSNSVMNICHFQYEQLIATYEKHFSKVHIFLYEDFRGDPSGVMERLSSVLGRAIEVKPENADPINNSLRGLEMPTKMYLNRFRPYVSPRTRKWIKPLCTAWAAVFARRYYEKNAAYLDQLLKGSPMWQQNQVINERYKLGMERYPDAYFPADLMSS